MWRKKIDIGLSAALNKLMTKADYERHTSSFQQWWTRLQKDVWPLFWQRGFSDHTCLLEYCTQMIHACLIFSLFFKFFNHSPHTPVQAGSTLLQSLTSPHSVRQQHLEQQPGEWDQTGWVDGGCGVGGWGGVKMGEFGPCAFKTACGPHLAAPMAGSVGARVQSLTGE